MVRLLLEPGRVTLSGHNEWLYVAAMKRVK